MSFEIQGKETDAIKNFLDGLDPIAIESKIAESFSYDDSYGEAFIKILKVMADGTK